MKKFLTEIAKALKSISKNLIGLAKKVGKADKPTAAKKAATRDSKPGRGPAPKKAVAGPRASKTIPDQVLEAIKPARKGINIEGIQGKTGLSAQQVNNALSKLLKAGSVSRVGRGVYTAAGGAGGSGGAGVATGGKKAPKAASKSKSAPKGKAEPKAKASPKATKPVAPKKGPKVKTKAVAAAPAPEKAKAKAKPANKSNTSIKPAQMAPQASRKPRKARVTRPVVEKPPVDQEPQVQGQEQSPADVASDTQPTSTETVE